uniref:Bm1261 n=1 Tax=Brugia malayi TaxID=6279 RepID=A0A1I9G1J7_BRUMA|nr:Bm1261 [Brugia malayi]
MMNNSMRKRCAAPPTSNVILEEKVIFPSSPTLTNSRENVNEMENGRQFSSRNYYLHEKLGYTEHKWNN